MGIKSLILGKFSWKRLIISLGLVYIVMSIWAHFISNRLMFPYNQSSYDETLPGLEFINADQGIKIATRYWKSDTEKTLILYFHGNYLDIGYLGEFAEKLNLKGYSVLAMDYRGYGLSQGKATDINAYQDSKLLYNKAIEMGYTSDQILIAGRSIGTGVATDLALNQNAKALILISPFVSAYRIITKIPVIPFDKFKNLYKISKITQPLLVVYGNKDKVIKPWHSEMIFDNHKGNKKKYIVDGAGHNDIFDFDLEHSVNQFELLIEKP